MNYLIVVAHPDDEVLGAGATIHKLTREGHTVDVCIMCTEAKARAFRPEDNELTDDMDASLKMLGVSKKYEGTFPNIEMNNATHLSLVQFIEKAIVESQPDVVITHHPADTNNDHMHTSMACQAAIRLFQRRKEVRPLKEFWLMEVLSSTEWSVNTAMNRFHPNTFVEVGEESVEMKIAALAAYRGVMRPYPHPRSAEAIKGLAAYRGAQSGTNYAEAFECVIRRLENRALESKGLATALQEAVAKHDMRAILDLTSQIAPGQVQMDKELDQAYRLALSQIGD